METATRITPDANGIHVLLGVGILGLYMRKGFCAVVQCTRTKRGMPSCTRDIEQALSALYGEKPRLYSKEPLCERIQSGYSVASHLDGSFGQQKS